MSFLNSKGDIVTTQKKEMVMSEMAKGVAHATVVPLIVFILVNLFIEGNFGGIVALGYMLIVGGLYNVVFKDKDLSKMAFNKTAGLIIAAILFMYGGWFLLYALLS